MAARTIIDITGELGKRTEEAAGSHHPYIHLYTTIERARRAVMLFMMIIDCDRILYP
jgi:hypothetical protein